MRLDPENTGMRVGVISPNIVSNIADYNAMTEDPNLAWPFELLAKRSVLLFDKLFLTEDLELTQEVIQSSSGFDSDPQSGLLQYLMTKKILFQPGDLGYVSKEEFLERNLKGDGAKLHGKLKKVGNPSNNCLAGETTYVGQPDIGDFEAHDGTHPRSTYGGDRDPTIPQKKRKYESLLLQRNAAMLRQAGVKDVAIISKVPGLKKITRQTHPVWRVVIKEMPDMDIRAPWNDVLSFRREVRTQHLVRSLRRWVRKMTTEEWTENEIEDEIRELVFEYEQHLRTEQFFGSKSKLSFVISGIGEISEHIIKLRVNRIARLISASLDKRWKLPESTSPGYELALIPEVKRVFHGATVIDSLQSTS